MQSLRGVSLPDAEVMALLRDDFVVGWRNIQADTHVGLSQGYARNQTAVGTTNGAGGRNVQLIVMAADETVLHVLPGFWHPEDLARELRFARALHRLWLDDGRSLDEKRRLYAAMHRAHVRGFTAETIARSDWQDFDRATELARAQQQARDTTVVPGDGASTPAAAGVSLKPLCVLVHDRMLARPFRQLAEFDMESFVDYGRPYYDNNGGIDHGHAFPAAERANRKRELEQAKADAAAAKAAKAMAATPALARR